MGKFPDPTYIRQLVFNLKKKITQIREKTQRISVSHHCDDGDHKFVFWLESTQV